MKQFPHEAQRLFHLARHAHEPPMGAKARTRSRVQARLSAGAALGLGAAASKISIAAVAAAVGKGPLVALALLGAGGVGFGIGKVIEATRVSAPQQQKYVAMTVPSVAAGSRKYPAPVEAPLAGVAAETSRSSAFGLAKSVPTVVRAAAVGTVSELSGQASMLPDPIRLAAETQLIRQAHQAIVSGNVKQALALLDEHARQFPAGILTEERVATQIIAHCRLGQFADAQARLTRFASTWPQSPHLARVRSACRQ